MWDASLDRKAMVHEPCFAEPLPVRPAQPSPAFPSVIIIIIVHPGLGPSYRCTWRR